jgi:hypothetical protein
MSFYARLQNTANKLLKGKGQAVTLTHVVPGTYDPSTGGVTNTTTTQSGSGAVFEYGTKEAGIYNAPGSLVKVGDKQLLLSALNVAGAALPAPVVNDTVTIGGVTYTITQVKVISPAGTPVMYDCNLRA